MTKEEGKFLKSKLSLKEPFIFPSLGLEKWDGSKEMLRSLLRKRGLIRFAKALSIQHVHLIWYICHRLDIGRGIFLFRSATKKEEPKIAERVIGYIEEILSLIKLKKEESS